MSIRENRIASVSNNGQQSEEDSSEVEELINTFSKRRVKLHEWVERAVSEALSYNLLRILRPFFSLSRAPFICRGSTTPSSS